MYERAREHYHMHPSFAFQIHLYYRHGFAAAKFDLFCFPSFRLYLFDLSLKRIREFKNNVANFQGKKIESKGREIYWRRM